ncbi:MAG: hypothetical protein ACHBN1_04055 [Heteroscytonema crispum UTEX LB 1556]
MLAQFQSLYPQGSLISELVEIFQGKYIVRASVQIDGVTRATGMAASETVEDAEDRAINRALMVLGITSTPQAAPKVALSPEPISQVPAKATPASVTSSELNERVYSPVVNPLPVVEIAPPAPQPTTVKSDTYTQDFSQQFGVTSDEEPQWDIPPDDLGIISDDEIENDAPPEIASSNVKQFVPRNYSPQEDASTPPTTKRKKKNEPVDLSDVIAKTDIELRRLGWSPEQGREYLIKTYNKRGRTLLTEEELHSFLKHLESQPTPIDGIPGF